MSLIRPDIFSSYFFKITGKNIKNQKISRTLEIPENLLAFFKNSKISKLFFKISKTPEILLN
jgi:hypothetical protein